MSAVKLPKAIQEKLTELSQQIRRLWLVRGISWFALVFCLTTLLAVLVDVQWNLSNLTRMALFGGWFVAMVLTVWRCIVRPMRSAIPTAWLAAAIEKQFPSLAERLQTLVELSEHSDAGNGSKALMDVLARETTQRTRKLNFGYAAPTGQAIRLGFLSALVTLAVVLPIFFFTGASARLQRFFLPWYQARQNINFKLHVSSGGPTLKRGESVTLTGYLERIKPDAILPETAVVVYRDDDSSEEKKLPMTADDKGTFLVTRPNVKTNFDYCLEAGEVRTDWHTVSVADPVELAAGTKMLITPPDYAKRTIAEQQHDGLHELEALQFSRVRFEMMFTRPCVSASVQWKASNPNVVLSAEQFTIVLNAEKTKGTCEWMLPADGTIKITLFGEQSIRTELIFAARATIDTPPKFERVTNVNSQLQEVRPNERVPIDLTVVDDLSIETLELEYALNDDANLTRTIPIPLKDLGTPRAEGRYSFDLTSVAKVGDRVRYRIRATDNRSVPNAALGPQRTIYPEQGWAALKVVESAKPLAEQEVLAQRDLIRDRLNAAAKLAAETLNELRTLQVESTGRDTLKAESVARLENAKQQAKDLARQLSDLASETNLKPELRAIANKMQQLADTQLRQTEDALRKASNESQPAPRDGAIAEGVKQLDAAREKLDELIRQNEELARNRLDQKKLEQLADRQAELAEQLKTHPEQTAEIQRKQAALNAELQELLGGNKALQNAIDALATDEATALAAEAKKLRDAQGKLDQAQRDQTAAAAKAALDDAAAKQDAINARAKELAKKTQPAAKAADEPPLASEPFQKAGDAFKNNDAVGALTEQEKSARELDRLADALERAARDRRDPRAAAEQLAKLEAELQKQTADVLKDKPLSKQPDELRKKLKAEQDAVRRATEKLSAPPKDELAKKAKQDALAQLDKTRQAIEDGDPNAAEEIGKSAEQLRKFADALPPREQRLKAAIAELATLEREQQELKREATDAVETLQNQKATDAEKTAAREKLTAASKHQAENAERLSRLDTPGLEKRRDKTASAAKNAVEDLEAARTQDIPASQNELKRQTQQLQDALAGKTPADELTDELAKKQDELHKKIDALESAPMGTQKQQLQELQRELANKLDTVKDPAAAEQLSRTRQAERDLAEALKQDNVNELKKKSKAAAEELNELADQLAGAESDADRAERLARQTKDHADAAKENAGKPSTPAEADAAKDQLQRELEDLKRTRTGDDTAHAAKQKATDSLERLQRQPNPERAPAQQQAAADAMQKLADELKKSTPAQQSNERGNPDAKEPPDDAGGALPNEADAQAARKLAREQRESRKQFADANEKAAQPPTPGDGAKMKELVKKQRDLAAEAEKLAEQSPPKDGQPGQADAAAKAAKDAEQQLKAGNTPEAQAAGQKSQDSLEKLAESPGTPGETAQKAKELAGKQRDQNDAMAKAAKDPAAQAAQQAQRQKQLGEQADQLAKDLDAAAKQSGPGGKVDRDALGKAAQAAKEAQNQMARAEREQAAGRKASADDARTKAQEALDRAAGHADSAKGDAPPEPASAQAKKAGEDVKAAGQKMDQAAKELGGDAPPKAEDAMRAAADKLNQGAKKLTEPSSGKSGENPSNEPGNTPGQNQGPADAAPTAGDLPPDLAKYAGKPWGELPGDVKTKIIQDVKAKYGEEYARVIKLYFEQIADRK